MLLFRAASPLRPSLLSSSFTTSTSAFLSRPLSSATITRTLPLFRRPVTARSVVITLGLSLPFLAPSRPTLNDSSPAPLESAGLSSSAPLGGSKKDVPVFKDGSLNPSAVKQISMGGMLGLGAGVLLSMFSRMLVLVLGVGIVVWQYAARRGYNFIPVERVQRYVKGINVRGAVHDNVAFKISFGLVFALTAFGEF